MSSTWPLSSSSPLYRSNSIACNPSSTTVLRWESFIAVQRTNSSLSTRDWSGSSVIGTDLIVLSRPAPKISRHVQPPHKAILDCLGGIPTTRLFHYDPNLHAVFRPKPNHEPDVRQVPTPQRYEGFLLFLLVNTPP